MITFAVLTFLVSRARRFIRGRAAPLLLLFALAPSAFGLPLLGINSARTEEYAEYAADPAEIQAEAEQLAFEEEFELFDEDAVDSVETEDPDWETLLRPKVRRKVGKKKYAMVTPSVDYGVVLTGPSAYREGATKSIAPASTSKVFTAAFALKYLGAEFMFKNRLAWRKSLSGDDAGYLRLVGSGDPSFTSGSFSALADEMIATLEVSKVKRIYGAVGFEATDARWSLTVKPAGWEKADPKPFDAFGRVSPASARRILSTKLRAKGIQWLETTSAPFASGVAVSGEAIYRSKPLKTLIQPFMLKSINSFGEALVRKVGEEKGSRSAENLHVAGMSLLREYVYANVGKNKITLNDGSGLSRSSRITADSMIKFLTFVKREPYFEDFFDAFPVAGETGTLETRMKKTSAAGRIHGKTGTIDGNYQLAGYLAERGRNGTEYHPFVILTDTSTGNSAYCRSTQDKVLAKLASLE